MKIYIDDAAADALLTKLLRQAGHDVLLPRDFGISGAKDPVHLIHAINARAVLLSRDHDDFRRLHDLVVAAGGHHPGVLMVRYDNDAARDLTQRGIVLAIGKVVASGVPVADEFIMLNHWR